MKLFIGRHEDLDKHTLSTAMTFKDDSANEFAVLNGKGTQAVCRIYYNVGAGRLHTVFLLTNDFSANGKTYKHMLVHNLPDGIHFVCGDDPEKLWALGNVYGPSFKEPIQANTAMPVSVLIAAVDNDLKLPFCIPSGSSATTCASVSAQAAITNCYLFARRMLTVIGHHATPLDATLAELAKLKFQSETAAPACGATATEAAAAPLAQSLLALPEGRCYPTLRNRTDDSAELYERIASEHHRRLDSEMAAVRCDLVGAATVIDACAMEAAHAEYLRMERQLEDPGLIPQTVPSRRS